jgi:hypothetical protein
VLSIKSRMWTNPNVGDVDFALMGAPNAGGKKSVPLNLGDGIQRGASYTRSREIAISNGEIHETLQICKLLTKRQIQCCNNFGCHGFEFAMPYRALPSFVNDPLIK